MARSKLNVLFIGNEEGALQMERIIKKFAPPHRFRVSSVPASEWVSLSEGVLVSGGDPAHLNKRYVRLEASCLTVLAAQPSAHIAVGVLSEPILVGSSASSHLSTRALLVDAADQATPERRCHIYQFVAEVVAPYLGSTGATKEQMERNTKTVLRNVFEGWMSWSVRTGRSAKFLESTPNISVQR